MNIAGGAQPDNPANGDGNAPNVTGHDYFAVDAPLKNFFTGDPLAVTITGLTGTSPTGDKTGCGAEDCYDPTNNDTIANGEVDPGTDADLTFDGHLDYQGVHELDVVDWDNVIEFNNLDPTKTYSIALTANRNNLSYDDARFSRVTIFGADNFTNASSPGVVVNSADSVSFSVGYNTAGNVARWTNVTTGPDGSFSILCEWDDGQGSGGSNTKGYAMALFELIQFSSSGMFEDFESGFDIGQPVGNNSAWFDAGSGPVVTNGIGFGGSVGLAPANNIFTWTAAPFDWNDPNFFGFTAYADFQTDGSGDYDDDRIGFMIADASVSSSDIFGVQLDPGGAGPTGLNIEGYWDGVTSDDRRPGIVDLPGALSADTFYRFEVAITKLRDATDPLGPAARVDASLWSLDGSGNPLAVVAMGSIPDTSLLGADEPHEKYFTGPIWPAFKNYSALSGAFDNASVSFVSAGAPSLCSMDSDCTDGSFCNGAETCDVGSGLCSPGTDPCGGGTQCGETNNMCLAPGDVIIAGFQAWNDVSDPPTSQSPGEFVELFNTTMQAISLEDMNLVSRVDIGGGNGTVDEDWNLRSNEGPNLSGLVIEAESFVLIGEGGIVDLPTNMDLATGEGGSAERAISLELTIDGVHMDYALYGRHDGSDPAG